MRCLLFPISVLTCTIGSLALPLSSVPGPELCTLNGSCECVSSPVFQPTTPTQSGDFVALTKRHHFGDDGYPMHTSTVQYPTSVMSQVQSCEAIALSQCHAQGGDEDDNDKPTTTSILPLSTSISPFWGIGPADGVGPAQISDPSHLPVSGLIQHRDMLDFGFQGPEFAGQHNNRRDIFDKDEPILIGRDFSMADRSTFGNPTTGMLPSAPFLKNGQPEEPILLERDFSMADMATFGNPDSRKRSSVLGHDKLQFDKCSPDVESNGDGQTVGTSKKDPSIKRRRVEQECYRCASHCSKEEIKKAKCHHPAKTTTTSTIAIQVTATLTSVNYPIITQVNLQKSFLIKTDMVQTMRKRTQLGQCGTPTATSVPNPGHQLEDSVATGPLDHMEPRTISPC